MGDAVVQLTDLTKRFGPTEALAGLSCELRAGEVVGLLGPNGAGKTTTLKLMLGMLRPSAGSATVLGLDCTTQSREVKEQIGYCPDEPAFYDFLTGRETLDFAIEVRGLDRDASWKRLDPLMAALAFGSELDLLVSGYSLGMKKKLAVLAALVHAPTSRPTASTLRPPPTCARCCASWPPSAAPRCCSRRISSTWPPGSAIGCCCSIMAGSLPRARSTSCASGRSSGRKRCSRKLSWRW
jgi:ABC-type transport system involved in cytochrome c biogenesis ATPase subunit